MWRDRVVMVLPVFDEHLGLLQCVEDLSIEKFVLEFPIEGLVEAVRPWASGSMNRALTPIRPSHARTAFAVNSEPLLDRM